MSRVVVVLQLLLLLLKFLLSVFNPKDMNTVDEYEQNFSYAAEF
jgi:hypothetical protein